MLRKVFHVVCLLISFKGYLMGESEKSKVPLQVVPFVDLKKYAGLWYEIARLPNWFQKDCASGVTASYTLQDNGKIGVLNQCSEASGRKKSVRGTAKVADKNSNAKLRVTFFWPFYGDYWIINLGSNYEYAVVGEPRRKYFWILSRTPEIEDRRYGEIIEKAKKQGYDLDRIIRTRQP